MDAQYETLRARGSSEMAGERYIALLTEVQMILSKYNPQIVWPAKGPTRDGGALCGSEFDLEGAEVAYYGTVGQGPISDADWPLAADDIQKLAAKNGFTIVAMAIVRPGQHKYVIKDAEDASLEFGGRGNTTASIYGSCHLTEADLASPKASSESR